MDRSEEAALSMWNAMRSRAAELRTTEEALEGSEAKARAFESECVEYRQLADVNMVILSHRENRTRGRENQSRRKVTESFRGPVVFANDLECWET